MMKCDKETHSNGWLRSRRTSLAGSLKVGVHEPGQPIGGDRSICDTTTGLLACSQRMAGKEPVAGRSMGT